MSTNWNELIERHEIAYLRGDLATSSPESYTIEEMKEISDGMAASTAEVDAALRADFGTLPSFAQGMLLDMLCASAPASEAFWKELLLGKIPDSVEESLR